MLNSCEIIDTIARDQWFYRTQNLHSHHQQAEDKGDEKHFKLNQMWVCPLQKQVAGEYYKSVYMGENNWQNIGKISDKWLWWTVALQSTCLGIQSESQTDKKWRFPWIFWPMHGKK